MCAETLGHEETKDGLTIQRAILSLIRARGSTEPSAAAEDAGWRTGAHPEAGADENSDTADTIINLLSAIQSSEIGARLRGEERGSSAQSPKAIFDEEALREAIRSTEVAARLRAEAGQENENNFPLEFDRQRLLDIIQGTATAGLFEGEESEESRQTKVLASGEPAIAAADRTALEALAAGVPANGSFQLEPVHEPLSEPSPAEPLSAADSDEDLTIETALAASDEIPDCVEKDIPAETMRAAPAAGSARKITLPGAPVNAKSRRITRRSSKRAMRKRISKPLRTLQIPAVSPSAGSSPTPATSPELPETISPVHTAVPSEESATVSVPCPAAPVEVGSETTPVQPTEAAAESEWISQVSAIAPEEHRVADRAIEIPELSEDGSLRTSPAPDPPADENPVITSPYPFPLPEVAQGASPHVNISSPELSPAAPRLENLRSDLFRPAATDRARRGLKVGRLAARAGAKVNSGLSSTADLTAGCLDRAEMQLESWFLKWFEPPDPRHSARVERPPLVAYHWIVDSPQALKIANISSGGLYLLTEDRWSEGNIISMTLQRTDREKGSPESWIAVDFLVMRWCKDGIAGAFLPHRPGLSDAVAGRAKNCADKKTLERFVKELIRR